MKFTIKVNAVKSINEIPGYWSNDDYINVLEALDFEDAKSSDPAELLDLLYMALSDLEPHESAELLLKYKLKDKLNAGQIQNLSHEMVDDNEAEGYPDIGLQFDLFNINQLLFKAYNGTFKNAKATKMDFELSFKEDPGTTVTKELALMAVCSALTDNSPIPRLFENQLKGKEPFSDAEKIVWKLHSEEPKQYTMITSDYWINKEDFEEFEISSTIKLYEDREE